MIFPAPNTRLRPIASNLLSMAQDIEKDEPGLYVLAAREFRYPVQQRKVGVRADQYIKNNLHLLETFVLRAFVEISPAPTPEELAEALGLHPIFITSTLNDLISHQYIVSANNNLQVTEQGRKFLVSEIVKPIHDTWYLIQDTVLNTITFEHQPLEDIGEKLEDLNTYIQQDLTQFPAFELQVEQLQPQLQALGLHLHNPDQGQIVNEMAYTGEPELRWKRFALFVLHDTDHPETAIQCRAYSQKKMLPLVVEWLDAQLQKKKLSLKKLCGLTDDVLTQEESIPPEEDTEVEQRLQKIRQQAVIQRRLQAQGQVFETAAGTATQLRDIEIRPAFLKTLREAREFIIIYSPWVNEQVVDEEFLALLEDRVRQGVRILIGYGIGHDEAKEERPMPASLPQRLRTIQTAEGTPGIIAEWLGNSHAKEIVVDRRIHLSGSHNWLSYRGDRFPRGETVYYVTIATEVEKAYTHLAQRFIERAHTLWLKKTNEQRTLALCILGYLGQEQQAAEWIQREQCYHLIPLWLTLATQALSSAKQDIHILIPLQTMIGFCSTAPHVPNPLQSQIITSLRELLKNMNGINQQLTNHFINENARQLAHIGVLRM